MNFLVQLCAVLSVFWLPLIFAIDFVDDCRHLGGPIFAEKDGWARIGCKTANYFGYCTLTRKNPLLTCKIVLNKKHPYDPDMTDCPEKNKIRFTGLTTQFYCEFFIENLQYEGNTQSHAKKQ
jgi:hypothetical protein